MLTAFALWINDGNGDQSWNAYLRTLTLAVKGPVSDDNCMIVHASFADWHSRKVSGITVSVKTLLNFLQSHLHDLSCESDQVVDIDICWWLITSTGKKRIMPVAFTWFGPNIVYSTTGLLSPKRWHPRAEFGHISILFNQHFDPLEFENGEVYGLLELLIANMQLRHLLVCPPAKTGTGAYFATHLFHPELREFLRDTVRQLFLLESYLQSWEEVARIGPPIATIASRDLCYGDPSLDTVEELCTKDRLRELKDNCTRSMAVLSSNNMQAVVDRGELVGRYLLPFCDDPDIVVESIKHASDDAICRTLSKIPDVSLVRLPSGYLLKLRIITPENTLQSTLEAVAQSISRGEYLGR